MVLPVERFEGCLLGLMAGDCLGLPLEGLSPERARRLFGEELRHRFLFGRGMASDDTEHACMTAQALLAEPSDPEAFARSLGAKLRLWLLGLPAGVGLATLQASAKLWLGFPPAASGVASAGNGPAMRAPVVGVFFAEDPERLRSFVRASTRLTHTDPRAERGTLAVAWAARYAALRSRADFSPAGLLDELAVLFPREDAEASEWLAILRRAVSEGWEEDRVRAALGIEDGVTGYIYRTVPAALWAWLASPFDFQAVVGRVLRLGGDTDTVGAVAGGLAGACAGVDAIPKAWLGGIRDFPRSADWVRRLARRLHSKARGEREAGPLPLAWPWLALRNPLFMAVVLAHGARRLLPPY